MSFSCKLKSTHLNQLQSYYTRTFCEHRGYHIVEQKVVKKRGIKIRLTHMKKGFIKEGILQKNENRNKIKGFSNNLQGR